MSESLARVKDALKRFKVDTQIHETNGEARTAQQAADELGCELDQIAKSLIFQGQRTGEFLLFLTAGSQKVDPERALPMVGQPIERADPYEVEDVTGFAIGGVAPLGHLKKLRTWMDPHLLFHETVWAAAGTPRHVFPISPALLSGITKAQVYDFTARSK
ncbi:MAG: YbaK/EbsC family protein [Pseudomonadota bacterium]